MQTFNDNVVVWIMVETIDGSKTAYEIAQVPGVHGVFGATGDLGNFSGFSNGQNDYDYLITNAHNAAHFAGKRACSSFGAAQQGGPYLHLQPELIRQENLVRAEPAGDGRADRTESIARRRHCRRSKPYRRS